jgi:serine/threonine-protein kinase
VLPPLAVPAVPDLPRDPLRDPLQATLGTAYTLVRELGGGGMSRVYVAREEALGRDVVVKVLAPALAEGLSAERFAREIRLAAGLQEPHIVPVLAAGVTAEGLPYYTMPFVRGESLRARLAQGPVPLAEAVAVLRDVATALDYAHGQRLVHRDIKPENVLLSGRTAVVTDFGIAKALAASKTQAPGASDGAPGGLTQLGTSLGTPAYMAPEQAAGDPATDHRADLYAWGVVAYELLAGRHPFAGKTSPQQLMAAHFAETPAPLPTPPVPAGLAALVACCLAKDPADRPASAADVLAALDDVSTGAHAGAHPGARAGAAPMRRRALAGAALALLALAGGAAAWRARAANTAGDAGPGAPPLVAVLPFEVAAGAGGVPADSAFADGLGDAITGKLARLAGLRVIDRASVRSVEGAAARPQAAGRTLGADYVLRATLRWARGADGQPRVQVSPVLVRVSDGTTRWAGEPTVVAPADPFAVQGALAAEVADALDIALAPAERTRLAAVTRDTAAFAAVERGRRILQASDSLAYPERLRRALPEFEAAYRRDAGSAEAWSEAAFVLLRRWSAGASRAVLDSAAVLARRALALDPGDPRAVTTLAAYEEAHDRWAAARALVERAVRAHPSNAELRMLLAQSLIVGGGDPAVAWRSALDALQLAPRSLRVVDVALNTALALRRYGEARELVARRQALDPPSGRGDWWAANVALAVGDTAGVARAFRAYAAKVGRIRASDPGTFTLASPMFLMQYAGRAAGDALLAGTPASFEAETGNDSVGVYMAQAQLLLSRGDTARARPLLARGVALLGRLVDAADAETQAYLGLTLAWFAAAQGDRASAERALATSAAGFAVRLRDAPGGAMDAGLTCARAEVEGLLGDVAALLAPLRRCLTMPGGYAVATLRRYPAFTRHAADPRVRSLAAELAATEQRARTTPVQPAR